MSTTLSERPTALFEVPSTRSEAQRTWPSQAATPVRAINVTDPNDRITDVIFDQSALPNGISLAEIKIGFRGVLTLDVRDGRAIIEARKELMSAQSEEASSAIRDCMQLAKASGATTALIDVKNLFGEHRMGVIQKMLHLKQEARELNIGVTFENVSDEIKERLRTLRLNADTLESLHTSAKNKAA